MWIVNLEPFISAEPTAVAAALGVPVAGIVLIIAIALRGTDPKDRPAIIKAVAELFRWRR
ncbi:hypothetical protein SAMN05443287_106200 [Micromonospora phaseoli]|uniref:Uncharacterized protein n=1 Tax=Micromonospora phaseoli TaxID=1144548 RepID=A0A1H7AWE5_9ACTN|nr:hypothetical protein CLV64_107188 [Micromonospora phaseoli]GIJ75992.1 hypothetical protein Xph01_04240 [Micromonospora phaseoli]SEJ66190.1 hypothetical protein SAMN05443287_106200 [Micromonospora phaseoli]